MSEESLSGLRYFLTFKSDGSNYRHVYFLRHKPEVFEKFQLFERLTSNKFGGTIKILRTYNGRGFGNQKMDDYLSAHGIKKENSAVYSGVKRKSQALLPYNSRKRAYNVTCKKSASMFMGRSNQYCSVCTQQDRVVKWWSYALRDVGGKGSWSELLKNI